ncbi:hypothetical protein M3Y98_00763100 [Aphelenchoides besseyi]|nr:hypothetical protein M3Y98_00763100 [Aphelenchoides besseyi]KAI6211664.1 hypothetical protein M3Y96_00458100 [Aphelenchoides besseyi]
MEQSKWESYWKLPCALMSSVGFGFGLRAAWKQARPVMKPEELTQTKLLGGVGFAARALGIATVMTVSGFGLLIVGVAALMDVNTPKQFGQRARSAFGDRLRLAKSGSGETYETLSELFEAASSKKESRRTD